MSFLRHVGKHGDRRVAIVYREVPGEPHMCLVVYTELLNRNIHDPMIRCIESDIGQNSENLADALNRSYTTDGQIILQKLHYEGQLKKVQTELVVVTPQPGAKIKLSDLNKILDEMKMGEDATRRLAEMDKQAGMQSPMEVARRMRGDRDPTPFVSPTPVAGGPDALGDTQLADSFVQQAERMQREANGLLAEAKRLLSEAAALSPTIATDVPTVSEAKKPRGRQKKTTVTA